MFEYDAVYKVKTDVKSVALTFDIGWGKKTAGMVLEVLERKNAKDVTFFVAAPTVIAHPEVIRRIRDMGFEIGSHGYLHNNYSEHSDEWIQEQVEKAEKAIQSLSGVTPKLIRTPNGEFDQRVLKKLHSMGYLTIHSSIDSIDWMNPGTDIIVCRVLSGVHPGAIILLHASDTAEQTADALPRIIDGLRDMGYKFVQCRNL